MFPKGDDTDEAAYRTRGDEDTRLVGPLPGRQRKRGNFPDLHDARREGFALRGPKWYPRGYGRV